MEKTVIAVLAAMGAAAAATPGHAATSAELDSAMAASSFSDLLRPVPNAVAMLKVADEQDPITPEAGVELAQYYHHHHHRRWRFYHHHHHHHHYRRFNY
jgi:hypothetical protein